MTDDNDTQDTSPEEGEDSENQAEALPKGFIPQDEWEGDPDDWVDHKEFARREKFFTNFKKQTSAYKAQINRLKKGQEDTKRLVGQLLESTTKLTKREYENKINELQANKRMAAQNQDFVAYDSAADALARIEKDATYHTPDPSLIQTSDQEQVYTKQDYEDYFKEWVPNNTWYEKDPDLKEVADGIMYAYVNKNPNPDPSELFDHIETKMSRLIKTSPAVAKKPAAGISGRKGAGSASPKSLASLNSLPADLREQAEWSIEMMLTHGDYKSKDEATKVFLQRIGAK